MKGGYRSIGVNGNADGAMAAAASESGFRMRVSGLNPGKNKEEKDAQKRSKAPHASVPSSAQTLKQANSPGLGVRLF
jgi:hypothetical protein